MAKTRARVWHKSWMPSHSRQLMVAHTMLAPSVLQLLAQVQVSPPQLFAHIVDSAAASHVGRRPRWGAHDYAGGLRKLSQVRTHKHRCECTPMCKCTRTCSIYVVAVPPPIYGPTAAILPPCACERRQIADKTRGHSLATGGWAPTCHAGIDAAMHISFSRWDGFARCKPPLCGIQGRRPKWLRVSATRSPPRRLEAHGHNAASIAFSG